MSGPASPGSVGEILATVRRHLRRGAGAAFGLSTAALAGAILTFAWLLAGAEGWTPGTPVPLLLLAAGATGLGVVGVRTVARLRRWTREANLAEEIEQTARLPQGSVRAQIELGRSLPAGVSRALARAGEAKLLRNLGGEPASLAGRPGRQVRRSMRLAGGGAMVGVLLVGGLWGLSPERARTAWAGLARPAALLVPEALPPLEIRPGDATLPRGLPPKVEITADGRDSVQVHWSAVGEVQHDRVVAVEEGRSEVTLPPLDVEVRYWASSSDGALTREYVLRPADPSLLTNVSIRASFPAYTRIPDETFEVLPDSLRLPEGTTLEFSGTIVGEGSEVVLSSENDEAMARFPVEGEGFSGSWRPSASTMVVWQVRDGREGALLPRPFAVDVVPDEPPELAFPLPGGDGDLPSSLRLPIVLEVADDYGVSWVEVETSLRTVDGQEGGEVVDRIPTGDRRSVTLRPNLDFSMWGMRAGDEVLLRARVADNAPDPQVTESPTFRLRMPTPEVLREGARERIEASAEKAAELLDRADREAREARELPNSRAGTSGGGGEPGGARFEGREEMRELLERQSALTTEVDDLQEDLTEARSGLGGEDPANQALRERIQNLERMLEELVSPEMRERIEELLEAIQEGGVTATEDVLEEIVEQQEELRERLERAMEQLERSVIEESFRGAEEELAALMGEQEAVAEQLEEGEGGDQQTQLADAAERLEERIDALERQLREAVESEAADGAAEAGQEMEVAREAMERAAGAAEEGNREDAGREAGDAAQSLARALQELEEAREEWSDEGGEAMRDTLRRGAQDALSLARAQGELRAVVDAGGGGGWGELALDQAAFAQGLRNLAAQLDDGLRQAPDAARPISQAIGSALQAMEATREALRGSGLGRPTPGDAAERAQEQLNQVALLILSMLEAGEGQAAADPAMDALLEELSALAGQQEALNEEARSFSQDPEGDAAIQDSAELALAQDAIAGALRDLANRPGGGETTGDLEALADEGDDIAEELGEDRLDDTTLERQDLFLERLLSAGRTLEREGPTEEREGTVAAPTERQVVSPLPETLLEGALTTLPDREALERLSPGQRQLVLDYFERVTRREGGDGSR